MKRFGIMFASLGMLGAMVFRDEAGEGGDAGAAAAAAVETKPAATQVETKPEPKPAPKEQPGDAEVLDKAGFAHGDDPGFNYAATFLAKNGFNADNPAVEAAMSGDFSLLKAELAAKGIQGWEQAIALGEQAYGRAKEAQDAVAKQVGEQVVALAEARGVDWEAAVGHVSGSASAEVKTALNELLGSPATAAIAAAFITDSYLNADGVEVEPQARATQQAAAAGQPAAGALSRAEFTKEMKALRERLGESYINSPEAQRLYARRSF